MALLVDGDLNRVEELRGEDSGVLEVANGEGIDLRGKLRLAEKELRMEVERFLKWQGAGMLAQAWVSEAMTQWHVLRTLETVYRDAYFSQLNDRYEKRWRHYEKLAEEWRAMTFALGIGLVARPVRRPAEVVGTTTDGLTEAATYWFTATYVNSLGEESAPSGLQVVSTPLPHTLTIEARFPPEGVAGWNVYVGTSEERQGRQNAAPLGPGEVFVLPETGLISGPVAGTGQGPASLVVLSQMRRG